MLQSVFHSGKFTSLVNGVIYAHCLTIMVRSSSDSSEKQSLLWGLEAVCFSVYIL